MSTATVVLDDAPKGTESTTGPNDANTDTGSEQQPTADVIEAAAEAAAEAVAEAVTENQQTQLLERIAGTLSEQTEKLEVILQRTAPEPEAVAAVAVVEVEPEPEPEPETPPESEDVPPAVQTRPRTFWQRMLGSGRHN
jgi:hypothetical protein